MIHLRSNWVKYLMQHRQQIFLAYSVETKSEKATYTDQTAKLMRLIMIFECLAGPNQT